MVNLGKLNDYLKRNWVKPGDGSFKVNDKLDELTMEGVVASLPI